MDEWQSNLGAYPLAGLIAASGPADVTPRLALHGWLDNAASMAGLLTQLNATRPAPSLALDLPGHGLSAHTAAHHHAPFADYLDAVLTVLDAQNWPQIDLIGHSMGGGIATLFAAAFPDRVRKLVLLDSLGPLSAEPNSFAQDLSRGLLARRAPRKLAPVYPDVETALNARVGAFGISELQARPIVARGISEGSDGQWRWRSDARLTLPSPSRFSEAQVLNAIAAIRAPTLIVLAEPRANFLDGPKLDARLAAYASAQMVSMPGNHHLHVFPAPDLVAHVAGFIHKHQNHS
jgi:pimeloyl-ACP methyl ester carboxylesterase